MLLSHQSDGYGLLQILKCGKILPASKTKQKSQNPYDFDLPYVFFNTLPNEQKIIKNLPSNSIVFDSSLLSTRNFYTNVSHRAGDLSSSKKYKKCYRRTNKELIKLYEQSIDVAHSLNKDFNHTQFPVWTVFQEVFIKGQANLKYATHIIITCTDINKKFIKKVTKIIRAQYPHIEIICDNFNSCI